MGTRARRWLFGASVLLGSSGCQVVLGDFAVDEAEPAPAQLGVACEPDAVRCVGAELERCAPDRQTWQPAELCDSADQCDPGAAACRPCTPGQWACNGAALESCDAAAQWQGQGSACESPELCHVSADRSSGLCLPPVCELAGAHRCDGNRLLQCASGRDQLTLVDRCASAELCDAAKADEQAAKVGRGSCVPAGCSLGTFACDGATLERCRDDQTGWDPVTTCADAATCNPKAGACLPCVAGETVCSGAELERCAPSGFEHVAACSALGLCDPVAGRCETAECATPGAVRCVTADLTSLEECGNDGRWAVREACATRALCSESAARCLTPACQSGETRCTGQTHQSCSSDLTHWVADDTCSTSETCSPAGCQPTGCVDASYRCNAASLELCVAGTWQPQNRCASAVLCNADTHQCEEPMCGGALGDFECDQQILRQCTVGRDEWTEFLTCTGERPVCDADPVIGTGQPSCDACTPLVYSCLGMDLHRCTGDGSAAPLLAPCPGGCSVASDGTPSCAN